MRFIPVSNVPRNNATKDRLSLSPESSIQDSVNSAMSGLFCSLGGLNLSSGPRLFSVMTSCPFIRNNPAPYGLSFFPKVVLTVSQSSVIVWYPYVAATSRKKPPIYSFECLSLVISLRQQTSQRLTNRVVHVGFCDLCRYDDLCAVHRLSPSLTIAPLLNVRLP
jgi:hypothetical protein